MGTALIRVDGSTEIGLGHIMRCLALARGLEKAGVRSIFVVKDYDKRVVRLIHHHGYKVESIPAASDFKEDGSLTIKSCQQYNADLIITDLCYKSAFHQPAHYLNYLSGLKATGRFLLTIDDVSVLPFPSDILLNPNYRAEELNYCFDENIRFLLGPSYFIFRQEFIEAANSARGIRKEAKNIVATLGGGNGDVKSALVKIVRALVSLQNSSLALRIVAGSISPHFEKSLQNILKGYRGNYEVLGGTDNMARLMLWSDLAITGGALTKYETAVTGTPSLVISVDEQQAGWMRQFERAGTALNLGGAWDSSEQDIGAAIERVLKSKSLRMEMSRKGKRLVDGKGIERIISELPAKVLGNG